MIIIMKPSATEDQKSIVKNRLEELKFKIHESQGETRLIIGAIGDEDVLRAHPVDSYEGVEEVLEVTHPFKLASRDFKQEDTVIDVNGIKIGGGNFVVMAGPCAVESREQIIETAKFAKKAGAHILRGGAFKPRTSPYAFQGLGEEGLKYMKEASEITGMPIITEIMSEEEIDLVAKYADILQVGARNMQNYALLKKLGKIDKPIFLKRGMAATAKDFLMAAEYIMAGGNYKVILAERGIRTFETATRNTLDLNVVPVVKEWSHLPIIIDPSHGTGKRNAVIPMARAAMAAGADGVMIEVHPNPDEALSDGPQSLTFEMFEEMMKQLKGISKVVNKKM
ncbi:MAG: 3-deoxy-7-phosphoheptulonate synthase [Fusobacteriia bacterium 4572_132]|nr:MAG: 3-deoxy-7-phosphoheptulonate synthase [Fusobacteriia bacterium 4572_132]